MNQKQFHEAKFKLANDLIWKHGVRASMEELLRFTLDELNYITVIAEAEAEAKGGK
jgi:hypothetical protein